MFGNVNLIWGDEFGVEEENDAGGNCFKVGFKHGDTLDIEGDFFVEGCNGNLTVTVKTGSPISTVRSNYWSDVTIYEFPGGDLNIGASHDSYNRSQALLCAQLTSENVHIFNYTTTSALRRSRVTDSPIDTEIGRAHV